MPGLQKKLLLVAPAVVAASTLKEEEAPVKRVVGLLEKMKAELSAEADKESEMYDKMVCWCETSEKEKTTAVAQAEASIADLQAEIEERAARFGTLGTEIDALKKQIAEDTAALKQAQAIREGEAGDFRDQEKFVVQTIANLKNAIAVLGKHQNMERGLKDPKGAASLAQLDGSEMSGLRVVLKDIVFKYDMLMAQKASAKGTSLLAVAAKHSSSGKDKVESSLSQKLRDAMNADHEDSLPLKFAEKVLAREAGKSAISTNFLQASGKQPMSQSYASQSGGIFGVLEQMLEEFEAQLKSIQGSEGTAGTDYAAMAAAKTEQIDAGKKKLDELEGAHADNVKALSDAKENLAMTTEQRADDVEFLRNLKLTCNDLDAQWEARSKTRSEEITAVSETIAILVEDDAHEQLKDGGVAFLQTNSVTDSVMAMRRTRAVNALRKALQQPEFEGDDLLSAWRSRSKLSLKGPKAQLSTLAVAVQLDGFEKVKAMIDKLLEELKTQQKEEVDFKAYCIKELDENEKAQFTKTEEKEDLETKIAELAALMEKLASEITEANEQIAATQLDVKKASQAREDENAAFQTVVTDQRATQDILNKALQRLKDFYAKKLSGDGPADTKNAALGREVAAGAPGVVFLQVAGAQHQTPPVQFNDYKSNSGSSVVMSLIDQIIGDSKTLEKEAIAGEYQAQADYEKMVTDSNALVAQLEEAVNSKTKASAQAKMDKGAAESGKQLAESELESLAQYESDLHSECDFVLKNFDIRQKARLQEMEAIQAAKAILSGSQ